MFQGILAGLVIAVPVGPVGLACIDQGMRKGFRAAFALGLGSSCMDVVFAALAYWSDQAISNWLAAHGTLFGLLAGAFFLYLGVSMMLSGTGTSVKGGSPFLLGIMLTIVNPLTILAFLALATVSHATWSWVLGVGVGAVSWWAIVACCSHFLGRWVSPKVYRISRWVSGAVICGLGLLMAIRGPTL